MRVVLILLTLSIVACEPDPYASMRLPPHYGNETEYEIIDSGFYVSSQEKPYWLDNSNVLVLAISTFQKEYSGEQGKWKGFRLAVWNIETKEHYVLHDRWPGELCYDGEHVFFSGTENSDLNLEEARYVASIEINQNGRYELGDQKEYLVSGRHTDPEKQALSEQWRKQIFECKRMTWSRPEEGDFYMLLKPWNALLSIGPRRDNERRDTWFESAASDQKLLMPFDIGRIASFDGANYIARLDRYLIQTYGKELHAHPEAARELGSRTLQAWWLFPDSRTEEIPVREPWTHGDWLIYSRHGLIHKGADLRLPDGTFRNDGLIDIDSATERRLIYGQVSGSGVSPDACKLAFYHRPTWASKKGNESLKVIKMC